MKKKIILALSLVLALTLTACGGAKNEKANAGDKTAEAKDTDNKIVVGVSPTPHGEIVEGLKDEFDKAGLDVEIVNFDDYIQPNLQLEAGDLDANYFQHKPYLDSFTEERNITNLDVLGYVHIEPMALYSEKYKSVDEIEDGAEIIIPNDPSNGARALILLEDAGLIKLKDKTNLNSTEKDIAENPKNLKFTAMDAPSIAQVYKDSGGAVINSNFAIGQGLDPTKDSIFIESTDSPYANLVAIRKEDAEKEKFKKFIEVLNSDASKKLIEEKFEGAVIPALKNKWKRLKRASFFIYIFYQKIFTVFSKSFDNKIINFSQNRIIIMNIRKLRRKNMDRNDKYENKNSGMGKIIIIIALVFSLIGGIIGSAIIIYKLLPMGNSTTSNEDNSKITISAKDNITVASAVAKKSMSSVVGITTKGVQQSFFGQVEVQGVGSGVIVDSKGYILTNAHVVKLNNKVVEDVTVRLNNEKDIQGKTIWADENVDLAIVKINTDEKLNVASLGDSDKLSIGDAAIAIGNPISLQFSQTVTQGIISGLDRYVGAVSGGGYMTGLIQTDASINGGNSGGPLLNSEGEVVGINTVKVQSAEGLGFSIPINFIKPIVKQVIETGSYKEISMGMLTMNLNVATQVFNGKTDVENGIFVYKVYEGSPAAKAGLEAGDIITKIGKDEVKDNNALKSILYKYQEGDSAELSYVRKGKENTTEVTFSDYSIENDKEAQKDIKAQEEEREKQYQQRQQEQQDLFSRFRQEFENGF